MKNSITELEFNDCYEVFSQQIYRCRKNNSIGVAGDFVLRGGNCVSVLSRAFREQSTDYLKPTFFMITSKSENFTTLYEKLNS